MTNWQRCRDPKVVTLAIKVALVIGTILNLINHFDLLLGAPLTQTTALQVGLTYIVPYCVSDPRPGVRASERMNARL